MPKVKVVIKVGILILLSIGFLFIMYEYEIFNVDEVIDDLFDDRYNGPKYNVTGERLAYYANALNITIGAAMHHNTWKTSVDKELYGTVISSEFNQMSFEWVISMDAIWIAEDQYNWKWADQVVEFAKLNNMVMRGSHLVWYDTIPDWLSNGDYTNEQVETLIKNYIFTVMQHYKIKYPGVITEWIAANEGADPNGEQLLRTNFLTEKLGNDWINKVFTWAREADSEAKLMYNDYDLIGTEINNAEQVDKVLQIVTNLHEKKLIDMVGFQGHLSIKYPVDWNYTSYVMKKFTDLDIKVVITEFDVLINNDLKGVTDEKLEIQASYYENMFNTCLNNSLCVGITMWGVNDKYHYITRNHGTSWLKQKEDFPLLFDENFNPKPAYFQVQKLLEEKYNSVKV